MENNEEINENKNLLNKNNEFYISYTEMNKRHKELQSQITLQQKLLHEQEIELNNTRRKLREEQLDRERSFSREIKDREKFLKERENQLQEKQLELESNLKAREAELESYFSERMRHTEEMNKKLRDELSMREKAFSRELNDREQSFQKREKQLTERQKELESSFETRTLELENVLSARIVQTEQLNRKLRDDISHKEAELQKANKELELEKLRYTEESRKQIETKSQSYVNNAITSLEQKEKDFHDLSKKWSISGGISISLGIVSIFVSTYIGVQNILSVDNISWSYLLFVTFRGLVFVALFIALSRYSFVFSNSYMHESLKNSERRHAINFGKFYLEAYGSTASWEQIKEAFQHWNINNDSAFSKKTSSEFDPQILEKTLEFAKLITKNDNKKSD